ncbi:MAG: hypothetical protein VXX28_06965 [Verrucomicrobiota bacterium]|nr:hypothetical protein [Verrucomicrobiota bacterium]
MAQNDARDDTFGTLFGTTWVILGAILGPAGRQGAPKIDLFGAKSHQNLKKKNSREKEGAHPLSFLSFWRHLGDFGGHLGDFGRHLGPSWTPRGSQTRAFWHQVAPNSQKMRPRMRHQKMYEILIEI